MSGRIENFNGLGDLFLQGKIPPFTRNFLSLDSVPNTLFRRVGLNSEEDSKRCYFIMHKGAFFFNLYTSQQWADNFASAEDMLVTHEKDEAKIVENVVPKDQIPKLFQMFATLLSRWKDPTSKVPVLQEKFQLINNDGSVSKYNVVVALHISKMCQFIYFECIPITPALNFDFSFLNENMNWIDDYDADIPLGEVGDSILQLLLQN